MDFTLYWFMFPVSILVATAAMLSGIGGAALFTPIFILVFPLLGPEYVLGSTIAAIGTALITQTFGFLSGFIGYYRRRLIDFRLAARIVVVSRSQVRSPPGLSMTACFSPATRSSSPSCRSSCGVIARRQRQPPLQ